jgi:hypothetical protein
MHENHGASPNELSALGLLRTLSVYLPSILIISLLAPFYWKHLAPCFEFNTSGSAYKTDRAALWQSAAETTCVLYIVSSTIKNETRRPSSWFSIDHRLQINGRVPNGAAITGSQMLISYRGRRSGVCQLSEQWKQSLTADMPNVVLCLSEANYWMQLSFTPTQLSTSKSLQKLMHDQAEN